MESREACVYHALEMENVGDELEALQLEAAKIYSWVWEFDLEASLEKAKEMVRSYA